MPQDLPSQREKLYNVIPDVVDFALMGLEEPQCVLVVQLLDVFELEDDGWELSADDEDDSVTVLEVIPEGEDELRVLARACLRLDENVCRDAGRYNSCKHVAGHRWRGRVSDRYLVGTRSAETNCPCLWNIQSCFGQTYCCCMLGTVIGIYGYGLQLDTHRRG